MHKHLVNMMLYLVVTLLLAGVISAVMTHFFGYKILDAIFWIGLITFAIGALSSISGNATGSRVFSGGINDQYESFAIIETLRLERVSTNYYANLKKHAIFNPKVSGISVILAGVLLVLISYFLS